MRRAEYKQSILSRLESQDIVIVENTLKTFKNIYATLSHGKANYLLKLDTGEYKLNDENDYYVYAEIDTHTAEIKVKSTTQDITDYGYGFPNDAFNGKLYYNLDSDKSYIKVPSGWKENIRINICHVKDNFIEKTYTGSSQVYSGINPHRVGEIQFDEDNKPIKVETQDGFRFITEADLELLELQDIKTSTLENVKTETTAKQNISKHDLLARTSEYGIIRATNVSTDIPVVVIALNDASVDEECFIQEKGFITGDWRWNVEPNTRLFCNASGRLTLTPDWTANSVQEVGYVVDVNTIYFEPKEKVLINSLKVEVS